MEHSGTTLISDLFRQVPDVDAGLETGVLLSRSPREFPDEMPFAAYILDCWAIDAEELAFCCDTDHFTQFYHRLARTSRALKPGTTTIFDKTPRYLSRLESCLGKTDVPFVVSCKDPRAIAYSDFTRSGAQDFDAWFDAYAPAKAGYMRQAYASYTGQMAGGSRVLRVRLETLCLRTRDTCEAIFTHCRQQFRLEYLLFENLRYHQTRTNSISARLPFEYLKGLTARQQAAVARSFAEFDAWFYE